MFAYISGKLINKTPIQAVIDANGIGYEIHIPLKTFDKLPEKGEKTSLFIYFSFTESEGIRLFGFASSEEKELFKILISVSKIGPKIALSVLSSVSVNDFISAIHFNDLKLIASVPGLGKKTAERLVIELKDKVGKIDTLKLPSLSDDRAFVFEAESALTTLGYKPVNIRAAMNELLKKQTFHSSEELIKAVIKYLYNQSNGI
jgi:Holliday junction DNA helicase RuvA